MKPKYFISVSSNFQIPFLIVFITIVLSLFTGWTFEKGNEVVFQPRVYELMPPTTEVKVKDGSTIALGDLTESTKKTNLGEVPMLGDITYIGTLLKAQEKKTELMVLVTPRIIESME